MTIWNSEYPDPDNFGGGYSRVVQSVDTIVANELLKKALKEIIDECQQERVYATEIQEKRFIDEVEQRAKLALTIEESER